MLQPLPVEYFREVLDAEVTEDSHHHPGLLQLVGNLEGRPGVEPGTASHHQPLLPGQLVADVERVLVLHLDHIVDQREVHAAGDGAFANAFNQKLLWLNQLLGEEKLVENGAVGIRQDTLDVRVFRFQKSARP